MKKAKDKRKIAIALAAGLAITGIISASAASLGGVTEEDFGTDAELIASCDDDGVTVDFDLKYDIVAGVAETTVDAVTIGSVDAACDGKAAHVELWDSTSLLTGGTADVATIALVGGEFDVFTGSSVDAEDVEAIFITITG